jgi:hypothetical protein
MSSYRIQIAAENSKPVFLIQKGGRNVGRFTAKLVDTGRKGVGSAFTAIVMRIVTGAPVNVSGRILQIEPESVVGENAITEGLENLAKSINMFMTQDNMRVFRIEFGDSQGFVDDEGNRVSTFPALNRTKYKVSYSKYAT